MDNLTVSSIIPFEEPGSSQSSLNNGEFPFSLLKTHNTHFFLSFFFCRTSSQFRNSLSIHLCFEVLYLQIFPQTSRPSQLLDSFHNNLVFIFPNKWFCRGLYRWLTNSASHIDHPWRECFGCSLCSDYWNLQFWEHIFLGLYMIYVKSLWALQRAAPHGSWRPV